MIPKIIHYCWFGKKEKPESVEKCINSWRKFCPDYQIIEWNECNYDINKYTYSKEAYDAKKWSFVSDVARLDIVYQYGGIYLDTDVEVIKPLNPLLQNKAYFGFENEDFVATGLGFGAEKKCVEVKCLLEESYKNKHFIKSDGTFDMIACPKINTEIFAAWGLKQTGELQMVRGILFLPPDYLCPKNYHSGRINITENTYSIHHFEMSWVGKSRVTAHKIGEFVDGKSRVVQLLGYLLAAPFKIVDRMSHGRF